MMFSPIPNGLSCNSDAPNMNWVTLELLKWIFSQKGHSSKNNCDINIFICQIIISKFEINFTGH